MQQPQAEAKRQTMTANPLMDKSMGSASPPHAAVSGSPSDGSPS